MSLPKTLVQQNPKPPLPARRARVPSPPARTGRPLTPDQKARIAAAFAKGDRTAATHIAKETHDPHPR